jgi:hypothetical protein
MFTLIPKVGPFKAIAFKMPSPGTETLYLKNVNASVEQYQIYLQELKTYKLVLDNREFDTDKPTKAGEYKLTDQAYSTPTEQTYGPQARGCRARTAAEHAGILRIAGCTYL